MHWFFAWLLWCLVSLAWAQEGSLSPSVAKALAIVSEAMDEGREAEALARLKVLQGRRLRPYAQALVEQTRGYLLARQERYDEAITAFRAALDSGALKGRAAQEVRLNLGQLLLAEGQVEAGVAVLDAWRKEGGELTAPIVDWLAYAYYRSGRGAQAAVLIDQALARFTPRRSWYELRVALYLEADQAEAAVTLLEDALDRFPGVASFWRQLASAQLRLGREEEALAALAIADQQGLLPPEDLPLLTKLFVRVGAPYHGGRRLRTALQSGKLAPRPEYWGLVGAAFRQAREREEALDAYARAARLAKDGRWDLRQGELLVEMGDWQRAEERLRVALERGVTRPVRARYLLGVALASAGRVQDARARFQKVVNDEHLGPFARRWLERLGAG